MKQTYVAGIAILAILMMSMPAALATIGGVSTNVTSDVSVENAKNGGHCTTTEDGDACTGGQGGQGGVGGAGGNGCLLNVQVSGENNCRGGDGGDAEGGDGGDGEDAGDDGEDGTDGDDG